METYKSKLLEEADKNVEHMKSLLQQDIASNDEMTEDLRVQRQKKEETEKRMEKHEEEDRKIRQIEESFYQLCSDIYEQTSQLFEMDDQQHGLSPKSIQRFHLFTANDEFVGQQCAICLQDINVGRRMRRLTCDGNHAFCPGCCETWFANNNTCPLCRHAFV